MPKKHPGSVGSDSDPNETESAGYSSPPCYAHEVDPNYFMAPQPMPVQELTAFLNTLLEAERAGAKTITYYLRSTPEGSVQAALASTGRDEARYTALLRRLIDRLGGTPSNATGSFYDKARAIEDGTDRLAFLNRGQAWVARKLGEALPRIEDPEIREPLREMHETHLRNIASCAEAAEEIEKAR